MLTHGPLPKAHPFRPNLAVEGTGEYLRTARAAVPEGPKGWVDRVDRRVNTGGLAGRDQQERVDKKESYLESSAQEFSRDDCPRKIP